MERAETEILILAIDPLPESALASLSAQYSGQNAVVVYFRSKPSMARLPAHWTCVAADEVLDFDAARDAFLEFLDGWPRRALVAGRSFDEQFRLAGDFSLWWTSGPGSARQPVRGPLFPKLLTLWISACEIDRRKPDRVVVFAKDARVAAMIESKCARLPCPLDWAQGSARPLRNATAGRWRFVAGSLALLIVYPLWSVLRALYARLMTGLPRDPEAERDEPAVVMTGVYPQHVRAGREGPEVWFWREVDEALSRAGQGLRPRYLFHNARFRFDGWRRFLSPVTTGWRQLRNVKGVLPLHQAYACADVFLKAVPAQLIALMTYLRWERQPAFLASFDFAGADAACVFVPLLRQAVAGTAKWARNVEAVARSLRAAGDVRVALVSQELYPKGMLTIAAARKLKIPTVGVQHGTISPMHLVYTIPEGQVQGAPLPDFFAVYGQFAKEVVSLHGRYPANRVWITGSPRFDHLVDRSQSRDDARRRLALPPKEFMVLLTTQRHSASGPLAETVFQAVREIPGIVLCVKTHPHFAATDRYRELARRAGLESVHFYRDRLDELIAACDVMISMSSTTLLEAALAGRRTIVVKVQNEPEVYPYVAEGASLGAKDQAELEAAIRQVMAEGDSPVHRAAQRAFLVRHLGPSARGEAADTLARLVLEQFAGKEAGSSRLRFPAHPQEETACLRSAAG